MRRWVAIIKAYYESDTYAEALAVAEATRQNAEKDFDEEDWSAVAVVLPLGVDDTREEAAALLRRARNTLIRLGDQRTVDVAREVDMIAEILVNPSSTLELHAPYDYGKFMRILADVMKGKDPGV